MDLEMVTSCDRGHLEGDAAASQLLNVLARYSVGAVKRLTPLHGGQASEVWRVEAAEGDFVLHSTRTADTAHLLFCLHFSAELARRQLSFAVPEPVRDQAGRLLLQLRDRQFWLSRYIPGRCSRPEPTPPLLREVARLAAELHRCAADITSIDPAGTWSGPFDRWWEMGQMRQDAVDVSLSASCSAVEAFYLEHHDELLQALWALRPRDYSRLPTLPIHSDLRFWNLIFENERVTGVLDFGGARIGTRVSDVSWFVLAECRQGERTTSIDLEQARYFLSEYERHAPLSAHERSFIPDILISGLVINFWGIYRGARGGLIEAPMEALVAGLAKFRWTLAHREEIAAALG